MAEKRVFTKAWLESLEAMEKRFEVVDKSLACLRLAVYPTGRKCFYFVKWNGGKTDRILLGQFPAMTIYQARAAAGDLLGGKKEAAESVCRLGVLFFAWLKVHKNLRTIEEIKRSFERDVFPVFGKDKNVNDIKKMDVVRWFDKIGAESPIQANRAFAYFRAVVNWVADRVRI